MIAASNSQKGSQVPAKTAKILVVDDDPSLRRLLSMRLKATGYEVVTAASAEEAVGKFASISPQLVITDLKMDGMDGMALFEYINHRNPSLPVVILTAHGTIPDAVDATQKGVFGYLTKPFDSDELLQLVSKATSIRPEQAADNGVSEGADWRRDIITQSPKMESLLEAARRAAASDVSILIQSESGTGKELLAKAIHRASARAKGPFVAVNCSAIPEQLLESELFGHVKGAFTGATEARKGLFQEAQGGTIFLDEIGDMPLSFQAKLLRTLQEKEVKQVGADRATSLDVRVISATHRDLERAIGDGEFREDLFYRINVVPLELPPLRERREDIQLLANYFSRRFCQQSDGSLKKFSNEASELLIAASWPGNVRQLQNVVEQTCVLAPGNVIPAALVQKALRGEVEKLIPLNEAKEQFEREYLIKLLQITEGNISQAARIAERNRTDFYKLLNRHSLVPELFRNS